jgi:hypothetical protein
VTREYVEALEKLIFKLYDALVNCVENKFEKNEYKKAPVIFLGDTNSKQEITGSPFWSNLYGKDADDKDLEKIISENTIEDNQILLMCLTFMEEIIKDDYSVKKLKKLVFPPTRKDWGDFSELHKICKQEKNLGYSSKVRYNDKHDMAYVHIYRNVEDPFIINQPHIMQNICAMTLVHDNELGWRIYQIGEKADSYVEILTISQFLKRVLLRKN